MVDAKKTKQPKKNTVKVGGKIADGKGGFLKAGDSLPNGCDIKALKAKGLV